MIFEIKGKLTNEYLKMGINQLKNFRFQIDDKLQVPAYLVFSKDVEPYFEVVDIDKYNVNLKII